jgi:hypothetical protein
MRYNDFSGTVAQFFTRARDSIECLVIYRDARDCVGSLDSHSTIALHTDCPHLRMPPYIGMIRSRPMERRS